MDELKKMKEENQQLRDKLEQAHRELADSVRAEIELQFKVRSLWEQLDKLKND